MDESTRTVGADEKVSLRKLIMSVKDDAQSLVKGQVELTSTELKESSGAAGGVGALFIAALACLGMAGIFLLVMLAYILVALGLPVWAGFGIVALLLIIAGAIMGLIGRNTAKKVKGPTLSKIEWEKTQAALTGKSLDAIESGDTGKSGRAISSGERS